MEAFQVEHGLGKDYYYNYLKDNRILMHLVGYDKFYCRLYYNKNDNGDAVRELRIFNSLHNQYKLKEFGWTKFSFRSAPAEDYWLTEKSPLLASENLKKGKKKNMPEFISRGSEINFANNVSHIRIFWRLHSVSITIRHCSLRCATYYHMQMCCCFAYNLKFGCFRSTLWSKIVVEQIRFLFKIWY